MLTVGDIHNINFSKALSGYKADEVDIFIDKVEADYIQHERIVNELQSRIEHLNSELEEIKASQESIQNVLLKSQILADKIIAEAKEKSEEIIKNAESNISIITAKEKELSQSFEIKAQERKEAIEKEIEKMISDARRKADSITAAATDSVERQQVLFEKLKLEIAAFKSTITGKYKEHLDILNSIPDTVPSDPRQIAEIVSIAVDKSPNPSQFVVPLEENTSSQIISDSNTNGFVIGDISEDTDVEE